MFKKLLLPALLALSLGATVLPAVAADVALSSNVAPPPLRVVPVPAPRAGYRGSPGHWNLRNHRHVWTNGVGMRHDKDGDGMPNQWDMHPANPTRP